MSDQNVVIWTPFQRDSVIDFLKLYTRELEQAKDNPEKGYGLEDIQKGVLHLADKVLPSRMTYVVNSGPDRSLDEVQAIFTDEEAQAFENARSEEKDD